MPSKKACIIARHANRACLARTVAFQREFGVLRVARLFTSERCRYCWPTAGRVPPAERLSLVVPGGFLRSFLSRLVSRCLPGMTGALGISICTTAHANLCERELRGSRPFSRPRTSTDIPLRPVASRCLPLHLITSIEKQGSCRPSVRRTAPLIVEDVLRRHSRQIGSRRSGLKGARPPPLGWTMMACRASVM